jgi:hypothetical protein
MWLLGGIWFFDVNAICISSIVIDVYVASMFYNSQLFIIGHMNATNFLHFIKLPFDINIIMASISFSGTRALTQYLFNLQIDYVEINVYIHKLFTGLH